MRAPDSWFPFCSLFFGMIRHQKLAGPTFLPCFQLSRHQRTSSHCWMLSSWIWTRGSLADTATRLGTAWHCFVHASLFLNFVTLENYRGCFIQPRLRQWMSYSPWCVICRLFVFLFPSPLRKILWKFDDSCRFSQKLLNLLAFFCGPPGKYRPNTQKKMAKRTTNSPLGQRKNSTTGIPFPLDFTAQSWGWDSKPTTFVRCWSDCWVRTWATKTSFPRWKFTAEKQTNRGLTGGWWPLMVCEFEP